MTHLGWFDVGAHPKVFVCHASEDSEQAWALAHALANRGFPVWLDKLCLLPGQNWQHGIEDGIDTADAVVVLVSKTSVGKTGFLQKEVRIAADRALLRPEGQDFIYPVLLDGTRPPRSFDHLQYVVAQGVWVNRLIGALGRLPVPPVARRPALRDGDVHIGTLELRDHPTNKKSLILDYVIDLHGHDGVPVWLGASVIGADGREHYDQSLDQQVVLRRGVAFYRRHLARATELAKPGAHLSVSAWSPRIGHTRLSTFRHNPAM